MIVNNYYFKPKIILFSYHTLISNINQTIIIKSNFIISYPWVSVRFPFHTYCSKALIFFYLLGSFPYIIHTMGSFFSKLNKNGKKSFYYHPFPPAKITPECISPME